MGMGKRECIAIRAPSSIDAGRERQEVVGRRMDNSGDGSW